MGSGTGRKIGKEIENEARIPWNRTKKGKKKKS